MSDDSIIGSYPDNQLCSNPECICAPCECSPCVPGSGCCDCTTDD